jgi:hypothetical protein
MPTLAPVRLRTHEKPCWLVGRGFPMFSSVGNSTKDGWHEREQSEEALALLSQEDEDSIKISPKDP